MELWTKEQHEQLRENGLRTLGTLEAGAEVLTATPVVKWFKPDGAATWLICELEVDRHPETGRLEETGRAYGLCDLGFGTPEIGYVMVDDIADGKYPGARIERDLHFKADKTLEDYAAEARDKGRIVA